MEPDYIAEKLPNNPKNKYFLVVNNFKILDNILYKSFFGETSLEKAKNNLAEYAIIDGKIILNIDNLNRDNVNFF